MLALFKTVTEMMTAAEMMEATAWMQARGRITTDTVAMIRGWIATSLMDLHDEDLCQVFLQGSFIEIDLASNEEVEQKLAALAASILTIGSDPARMWGQRRVTDTLRREVCKQGIMIWSSRMGCAEIRDEIRRLRGVLQGIHTPSKTMDDVAAACDSLIMTMQQVKDFNPFLIATVRHIRLSVDAAVTATETVPQLVVSEEVVKDEVEEEVEEEEVEVEVEVEEVKEKPRPPYNNVHWPSPLPRLILKEFGCTDRYTHMEALQMLARIFRMSVQTLCVTSRAQIAAQHPLRCYSTHHLRRWFAASY
jgi:hypothetical protein